VLSDLGSFGGLFRLDQARYREPVLVSSADGVGTKLKVAFMTGRHDTVGADLVNHCVNDILVQGAEPLFFLDYLATGRLSPEVAEQVIAGIARSCRENGCALIGGETAEMPGFYADGEYDLAGFIVGIVEQSALIDGRTIAPGDAIIGLPSAGLHTNGYSLARRVLFERAGLTPDSFDAELGATIGDVLLAPHRSYLSAMRPVMQPGLVKGMAHITGGGITENLPRILPDGCAARIDRSAWSVPPIFRSIQRRGQIGVDEMYRVFNMGIGLIVVCAAVDDERVLDLLQDYHGRTIGHVIRGDGNVIW
jgi:phosphoribosylformylglycinamidine cyclo-ligase